MSNLLIHELAYRENATSLFANFADDPWAVYIDSAYPYSKLGRFEIISAQPSIRLTTLGKKTTIETDSGILNVSDDPFLLAKENIQKYKFDEIGIPFVGGAIGYFSYDLGRRLERLPAIAKDDLELPTMKLGIYPWAIVIDHANKRCLLVGNNKDLALKRKWSQLVSYFSNKQTSKEREEFVLKTKMSSNMTKDEYRYAFQKIKNYIIAGDCYQVNLAQRFNAQVTGDPWLGYLRLRKINPSPFSAYLNYGSFQVLSSSPERFLKVERGRVQTKPIKGTRPRSKDVHKDRVLAAELAVSVKDQAENVMIVDLLRNDLSKNCLAGTVKVPKLFEIESYPTVHHMVSTIIGTLRPQRTAIDLLRGCFPGGSITGAPKIRAMEIIEELEPHRRNIYCGSIGYMSYNGMMDTNIAIRTILHKHPHVYFYAGGGIVYDSEEESEYQETFDKAAAMINLLENKNETTVGN